MDKNNSKKTDQEIAKEFDRLFNEMPEPDTTEEIEAYLIDAGYDPKALKADGLEFVNNLMSKNWRFVTSEVIDEAAKRINRTPIRQGWSRSRLVQAIRSVSGALSSDGVEPALAFRNLDELTDEDLASILQELEYKANIKGINLDLG